MMIGQALIKSVAFSANEAALGLLNDWGNDVAHTAAAVGSASSSAPGVVDDGTMTSSFVTLILAASFSGFVTSFLVAPVGTIFHALFMHCILRFLTLESTSHA